MDTYIYIYMYLSSSCCRCRCWCFLEPPNKRSELWVPRLELGRLEFMAGSGAKQAAANGANKQQKKKGTASAVVEDGEDGNAHNTNAQEERNRAGSPRSPPKRRRHSEEYLHRKISSPLPSPFVRSAAEATPTVVGEGDAASPATLPLMRIGGYRETFVIGVAGGTASGKTTVCDKIIQELHDHRVVLISQDSYYRGLTEDEKKNVSAYNFDHPDAIDCAQLHNDIIALKQGKTIHVPVYDFKTHSRMQDEVRVVNPADVVIVEGILVLQFEKIRELLNMKIFVDTDDDVRLARRIQRDTQERGRDVSGVIKQYTTFVKPMFDAHVLPSKKFADIIIPWAKGNNYVAIDLIVQHIRSKLGTDDLRRIYPLLSVIQNNFQIRGMHTIIRDRTSNISDFIFYADRLIRVVVEAGLGLLPFTEKIVETPTGSSYVGVDFCRAICGVSIVRSGESMETALRNCCKGAIIVSMSMGKEKSTEKESEKEYVCMHVRVYVCVCVCVYVSAHVPCFVTHVAGALICRHARHIYSHRSQNWEDSHSQEE